MVKPAEQDLWKDICVDDMSEESDDLCNPNNLIVHKLKWCSQGKCIYTVYLSIYPHRTNRTNGFQSDP